MDEEIKFWGIHNNNNDLEIRMLDDGFVALGWKKMGDLSLISNSREAYYKQYTDVYFENSQSKVSASAGQLFRFVNEAKIGDYIVLPTKFDLKVNIGVIESDYYYDATERDFPHKRKVKWLKTSIDRDLYSQAAKYEFGSFLSFFNIKNFKDEHEAVLKGEARAKNDFSSVYDNISIDAIAENTKDYIIKELKRNYKGYDFEKVVSWLLNAMGYRTKNSPKGGDHGVDIIAYRDELPPRIVIQVKSQDGDITEENVQSLKGALNMEDYGLFVTLSDFKKNARDFLAKQSQIKSINGSEFVDLLLKYYESMPDEFTSTIKLKMVYMPILDDDSED